MVTVDGETSMMMTVHEEQLLGDDSTMNLLDEESSNLSHMTHNLNVGGAYEEDCDSIRAKITALLAQKNMTQIEFLKLIGCSSDSLSRFMKLKGNWNGTHNRVFWESVKFFSAIGNEAPPTLTKKRKLQEEDESTLKKTRHQIKIEKRALKSYNEELFKSVSELQLPLELESRVPVYDNCDEIRAKSNEFIETCGLRIKEWLRMIGNVNTKSWNDFLSYKGERGGAANRSYYAAYVFLEKVRIARGEEKSTGRLLAELEFGELGRELKHDFQTKTVTDFHQRVLKFVDTVKLDTTLQGKVPVYDGKCLYCICYTHCTLPRIDSCC